MNALDILDTSFQGLKVIQRRPLGDHRGYLERMYCAEEMRHLIPETGIVQINHTMTNKRGTVRGMHFQYPPFAETKIISCLRGEVFDVAVDLRQGSATFLHWHAEIVSAANHKTLLIPKGFAHGFQALTDGCELIYFHTAAYQPSAERGVNSQDPRLDIRWPLEVLEMSFRDATQPLIDENFEGVAV